MSALSKAPAPVRRLSNIALAVAIACSLMLVSSLAALAQPTPRPTTPTPTTGRASSIPTVPVGEGAPPAALNSLIDPARLASLQQSIVGLVILWEEPESTHPFAFLAGTQEPAQPPAVGFCTGWFSSETTIVTAGHCVDPAEGRRLMDWQNGPPTDPTTGEYVPPAPVRPEPARMVYAFQPRELAGAVISTPTHPTNTTDTLDGAVPTGWPALLVTALIGAILGAGITELLNHINNRSRSTATNAADKGNAARQDPSSVNSENTTAASRLSGKPSNNR